MNEYVNVIIQFTYSYTYIHVHKTKQVGINDINSLESYVLHCGEDCCKIVSEVEVQPSDLGPAKMHKYVIQK